MESLTRHTDYGNIGLERSGLAASPFTQLKNWIRDAEAAEVFEPNAMVISTIDGEGELSSRTVLLKGLDDSGLEFVTNYQSRKGRALQENPKISAVFPWYTLKRQIIVTGTAERAAPEVSDAYHARRPRGAQLSAWSSDQSQPVESRDVLDARLVGYEEQFANYVEVPRPEKWGAFRITPTAFEFWQGRSMRFHDRYRYEVLPDSSWNITQLQP
jgi:pyridoxamine 5'-phosphate oxidase